MILPAPSKLNTMDDVPIMLAEVSPAVPSRQKPRVPMQATDVAVVQLVMTQLASASTAVKVRSAVAKFMPVNVTLARVEATLYGDDVVRTGADGHSRWYALDVSCAP